MENILQIWLYFICKKTSKNGKTFSKKIFYFKKTDYSDQELGALIHLYSHKFFGMLMKQGNNGSCHNHKVG